MIIPISADGNVPHKSSRDTAAERQIRHLQEGRIYDQEKRPKRMEEDTGDDAT